MASLARTTQPPRPSLTEVSHELAAAMAELQRISGQPLIVGPDPLADFAAGMRVGAAAAHAGDQAATANVLAAIAHFADAVRRERGE